MDEGASKKKDVEKGRIGKIVLAICVLVIIVLVAVILIILFGKKEGRSRLDETKRNVVVNEENAENVVSEMIEQEQTPVGSYEVTMNTVWNFENGDAASDNAYVANAVANTNSVYFDVVRSDTGETIYASPILPVGTQIKNITLDASLEAGSYDCVCTYYLLDEDEKAISKVNVSVTIEVLN